MTESWQPASRRPRDGMAWAVRAQTRQPTYIGSLQAAETGLECQCVCPACGARLQAVGVGKPSAFGRVPFFRHHNTTQQPGCKFRVAELAALKLYSEQGYIEIPLPRATARLVGYSGSEYLGEALGQVVREAVVERRVVSEVEVELILASGRTILLTVAGELQVGQLGSRHAVIKVDVDDGELAWLSPEQILEKARLSGGFLKLIAHEQMPALQRQADDDARLKALALMDIAPEDFKLPVGATPKQVSESLLHWAVKDALQAVQTILTPEFQAVVSVPVQGGEPFSLPVSLPAGSLAISDARAEWRLDGYCPDVLCRASDPSGLLGEFELAVEVIFTSDVDDAKLQHFKRDGIACLRIDVRFLSTEGRLHRSQLHAAVATNLEAKSWLYHPVIEGLLQQARERVEEARVQHQEAQKHQGAEEARRTAQEQLALELQAREELERHRWASSLHADQLLKELGPILRHGWAGTPQVTSNGAVWRSGEFLAHARERLGKAVLPDHLFGEGGLLWRLHCILRAGRVPDGVVDFSQVTYQHPQVPADRCRSWQGLLHAVMAETEVGVSPSRKVECQSQRDVVRRSLKEGKNEFKRDLGDDQLVSLVFPELIQLLESTRKRMARSWPATRAEAITEERAPRQEALELSVQKNFSTDEIARRAYSLAWNPVVSVPASPASISKFLAVTGYRDATEKELEQLGWAWQARRDALPLGLWMLSVDLASQEDLDRLVSLLRAAYLVVNR